jgi:hypothetical protein
VGRRAAGNEPWTMEGVQRTLATLTRLYGGAARERQQMACISNDDVEQTCDSDVEQTCDSDAEASIDGDKTTMKGEPPQANLSTHLGSHKCPGGFP